MAINNNQLISMQYELMIDGNLIETNFDADPIEFTFGKGEVVPGLETRIKDMNEGETRSVNVPALEAYGQYKDELIEKFSISEFDGIDLQIGLVLEGEDENGNLFKATVSEVTKDEVTMDYNHPLSGKDLDFKVIIHKIV